MECKESKQVYWRSLYQWYFILLVYHESSTTYAVLYSHYLNNLVYSTLQHLCFEKNNKLIIMYVRDQFLTSSGCSLSGN